MTKPNYQLYPITHSAHHLCPNDGTDINALAHSLYKVGAKTLQQMGLIYFTEEGRQQLKAHFDDSTYTSIAAHAMKNALFPGMHISVVWKDDDETEAAWKCTIVSKLSESNTDYIVRCHSDNDVYKISTVDDEVWVHPDFKGIPTWMLRTEIFDDEQNSYSGNFNESGLMHDTNVIFTSNATKAQYKCNYENGILVSPPKPILK